MKRLLPILLLVFSVGVGAETISHSYPSGNKYVGEIEGGKKHSQGTFTYAEYSGDISQNVNFALNASLVRDMLEVKDIDYETASPKKELKTVDIFDKAKKFTVLVECLYWAVSVIHFPQ